MNISVEPNAAAGRFKTTRWTLVLSSAQSHVPGASDALATLCNAYWVPLFCFVRRRGYAMHEAQDLVQAFFLHLLGNDVIAGADRQRGRFRNYLLAVLENFLANAHDRASALKRGGACQIVSLDVCDLRELERQGLSDRTSPEAAFDLHWATATLDRAFRRLRTEAAARGKEALFDELSPFLAGSEAAPADPDVSLGAVAARRGVPLTALKSAVQRLRQRFRAVLRAEIARTVSSLTEVDEELQYLCAALARADDGALPGGRPRG